MKKLRYWLSLKLFRLGRTLHPEISELEKNIIKIQNDIGNTKLIMVNNENKK